MPTTLASLTPRLRSPRPRWLPLEPVDESVVVRLAEQLRLPEPVCALLVRRGFTDEVSAREFLKPHPGQLHPSEALSGVAEAVDRLIRARDSNETVLIHGDYDVDGICASAVLTRALQMMDIRAIPFVPHRLRDGYDLTGAGVSAARAAGATLIVTADCGIVAHDAVLQAREVRIDVIITDHHTPGPTLPAAVAIVNPNRPDCRYPETTLAGVGVAFKLVNALASAIGFPVERLALFLDLVALGTIADLAPLSAENRALARWGLAVLARTPNPGLRALIQSCGLADAEEITAGQVGFIIAPRLNALGRMGDAMRGVRLLVTDDPREAASLAAEAEAENRHRREVEDQTLADALRLLERDYDPEVDYGVVLASDGWHPGVIGIVASRIVERIHRPVVLIALADGEGKGSGRSIPGFHLQEAFAACAEHLEKFGGHRAAAGCSIAAESVDDFREAFAAHARALLDVDALAPSLRIDGELPIAEADAGLLRLLRYFSPFGVGNPTPVFAARGVGLAGPPRIVGKDHLKLTLTADGARLDAIGFGMADRIEQCTAPALDVAFKLEENSWKGRDGVVRTTLQARLVDLRRSE